MGRARSRSPDMEENSEDGRGYLRSQPHCSRQNETRSPQITTSPSPQRRRTTSPYVSSMPPDIPGTNRTCWTSSDQLHLSNCPSHRPPPASSSSSLPPTNSDTPPSPPLPSSSFSSTAPAAAVQTAVSHITNPNTKTDFTSPTSPDSSDEDQDYTCPHCDRTFTSHIGLVGHLRIHRTETGEPVPGAPTYTHRTRLHCPHCPRTFTHRMGLFGHMRIHESGIDRSLDTPYPPSPTPNPPPCAPTNHSPTDIDATDLTTSHSSPSSSSSSITATTTAASASVAHYFTTAEPDTTTGTTPATSIIRREGQDYICPHCDRTFNSRIGLVELLPIYLTLRSDANAVSAKATLSPLSSSTALSEALAYSDRQLGFDLAGATVDSIAYADDLVLLAESPHRLQQRLDGLANGLSLAGMVLNSAKCV
nr:unnamed protein product [Spirometra erinaceieuropaei]